MGANQNKTNNGFNLLYLIIIVIAGFIGVNLSNSGKNESPNNVVKSEKIICKLCGDDLTDNYNRIQPNGQGYFCMTCYHKMTDDVGSYSESDINDDSHTTDSQSQNATDYSAGSDGRLYENAPCSLCGGTGIEIATASNPYTNERESRICPQCEGRGHQSY